MEEKTGENPKKNEVSTMALLAYLGPLCLVPLLTEKKDEFVKFHVRQGMVLLICEAIVWFVWQFLFGAMGWSWGAWGFYSMLVAIQNLLYLGLGILSVLGIMNVVNGQQKVLPVLGKFAEKVKFVK